MRPTELHFRSPKEATPCPRYPLLTSTGCSLDLSRPRRRSTFGTSDRFVEYQRNAARLGFRVGPCSYDPVRKRRVKGGRRYIEFHGSPEIGNNGFYFCGAHLVFQPAFAKTQPKERSMSVQKKSRVSLGSTCTSQSRPMSSLLVSRRTAKNRPEAYV